MATQKMGTLFVAGVLAFLVMPLSYAGRAGALYPPDGTKPNGSGGYMIPADGMCVVGVKLDGTMLVDWSITNYRDCVAWTKSADSSVDLVSMDTQDKCTKAGFVGNDGYKHAWSTSLCYDVLNSKGISRVDLDNTDAMCFSKGGTVVITGKCVAYGWVYRNRKADNTLPVSGTGLSMTDGVQSTDGLGFCATSMRMTSATFTSAATCPSKHNSATLSPAEWPACLSSTSGCQTQVSYDAGLGWSWDTTNSRCLYAYGITGIINSAATKADGTTYAAGTTQDLTLYTNQGDCLANGFSWDNWLPVTGTTTKDNTSAGELAGLPAGAVIRRLDALSSIEDGGGEFYSGTGAICEKCHSDQSRAYIERYKPGYPKTRHKLAGDAIGKPFQPYFTEAGSAWGLQGVQCSMCHSTAKPAQDDLIQIIPAGVVGPPAAGAPKSAAGHNNTEYGTHLLDICYTCHGIPATPLATNPASVIPVSSGDLALTAKGLAPIANQFLNSPHAKYAGSSTKVDIGDKTKYGSTFEGYVCRSGAGKLSATTYPNAGACTGAGFTWYTTTSNGTFCYYNLASCTALSTGQWFTTFDPASYPWAADTGGPGGVCAGVGIGSIITTVYSNGSAEKIPNLDSTTNAACSNAGNGSATSGAGGFWVKDGETSPGGTPADTAQGNCMTCHDVHWALADTDPKAEPFRRECPTCHVNSGTSASNAPQVNLATINHLKTTGTPLENWLTDPFEACVICHMPKSGAAGSSPMHLWRINTSATYQTMGTTQANTAAAGTYTNAAWVDLEHACGQCHGGGTVEDAQHKSKVSLCTAAGVPDTCCTGLGTGACAKYRTNAQLAPVAKGMHASAGKSYPVTFSYVANGLTVNVVASVTCNGVCSFTYDWDWGDGTMSPGVGASTSHAYATAGTKSIALTVNEDGLSVGSVTRSLMVTAPDTLPVPGGLVCGSLFTANTWTASFTDASTDDRSGALVVVEWGDGHLSRGPLLSSFSHKYRSAGSYVVVQKVIDSALQLAIAPPCAVMPGSFTIDGHVYKSDGVTGLGAAIVTVKSSTTGATVKSVYTAFDGFFSIGSLKPDTYWLVVAKRGYTFPAPTTIGNPAIPVGPNSTGNSIKANP